MNSVSMTTNALRDILKRMGEGDLGVRVLVARDISGPGGRSCLRYLRVHLSCPR